MSRENFFAKVTVLVPVQSKDAKAIEVKAAINISNIDVIIDAKHGGSTVLMGSGVAYECLETREGIIKQGHAFGVMREL